MRPLRERIVRGKLPFLPLAFIALLRNTGGGHEEKGNRDKKHFHAGAWCVVRWPDRARRLLKPNVQVTGRSVDTGKGEKRLRSGDEPPLRGDKPPLDTLKRHISKKRITERHAVKEWEMQRYCFDWKKTNGYVPGRRHFWCSGLSNLHSFFKRGAASESAGTGSARSLHAGRTSLNKVPSDLNGNHNRVA